MKLVKAYNSVSLVLRIVIGMVIGAALALLIPNAAAVADLPAVCGHLQYRRPADGVRHGPPRRHRHARRL